VKRIRCYHSSCRGSSPLYAGTRQSPRAPQDAPRLGSVRWGPCGGLRAGRDSGSAVHLGGADGGGGQREAEGREDEERRREPAGHLCTDEGALSFVTAICSPIGILHTNESGEAE
jgi:hypothetical protein